MRSNGTTFCPRKFRFCLVDFRENLCLEIERFISIFKYTFQFFSLHILSNYYFGQCFYSLSWLGLLAYFM